MIKIFKRAVKLIVYRKGSEEDWEQSAIVSSMLVAIMRNNTDAWRQAQLLLEDLRKKQEHSLTA
jgi:hypothetical protein